MKRIFLLMIVVGFASSLTLVSCKSKAVMVNTNETSATHLKSNKIIENYYSNKTDFSTVYIKADAEYSDGNQTQNVTAEIKIKKDEQILISIRFLGITMAKALITPTAVNYYEKIGSKYFEGDFSALTQWLGTDLDFNKVQNLLLGRAIDDLKKGKYIETIEGQTYKLDNASESNTKKSFYFDAEKFYVTKQEITQTAEERMIQVNYLNNVFYKESTLPSKIHIKTFQKGRKTEINLDYNSVTFNEEFSFPYSVPNGYKRILIN